MKTHVLTLDKLIDFFLQIATCILLQPAVVCKWSMYVDVPASMTQLVHCQVDGLMKLKKKYKKIGDLNEGNSEK